MAQFTTELTIFCIAILITVAVAASSDHDHDLTILVKEAKGILSVEVGVNPVKPILGHAANLTCVAPNNHPIKSCRWQRQEVTHDGHKFSISLTQEGSSQTENNDPNCNNCTYRYIGKGLDKGDCTISVNKVSNFQVATWQCLLLSPDEPITTWIGNVTLQAYDPVSKPYFDNQHFAKIALSNGTESKVANLTCCVDGGDPALDFRITIGLENPSSFNKPLLLPRDSSEHIVSTSRNAVSVCRKVTYSFGAEDNGKLAICGVTYAYNSETFELVSKVPLCITFNRFLSSPVLLQEVKSEENKHLFVNVSFTANPLPDVSWYLIHDRENNNSFEVRETHPKYKCRIYHLKGDLYNATLKIMNVTEEDYQRLFKLQLRSDLGVNERFIDLRLLTHLEDNDSDKTWVHILIAIVLICSLLIVAILVACLLVRHQKHSTYTLPTFTATTYISTRETTQMPEDE